MNPIHVFLATGFEEIEALIVIDILRRAELDVRIVSISDSLQVVSTRNVVVVADELLSEAHLSDSRLFVLPGGMPGASNLAESELLCDAISRHHDARKMIAAICAAPLVLGRMGLLEGKRVTCYPGFEQYLTGAQCTGSLIETDGPIITAKGPSAAFAMGFAIVEQILGKETADRIKEAMIYHELVK